MRPDLEWRAGAAGGEREAFVALKAFFKNFYLFLINLFFN